MGPKHGDIPLSDVETISSSEEKNAWDDIAPEAYEEAMRDDPLPLGCHKVLDPKAGNYKPHKACCLKPTTIRCHFCSLPLCEKHTGQCRNKGCKQKRVRANQPLAAFSPDLSTAKDRAVQGVRELPASMMPAPPPLDSILHYPPLGTLIVGDVSIPIQASRAEKPASKIKSKPKQSKVDAPRIRVPTRCRSATPPLREAAPPQPAPIEMGGSEMLTDALRAHEEFEGTIDDPIEINNQDEEVPAVEVIRCSVADMFPDLGPPSPDLPPHPLSIVKTIIAERVVDVEMDEVEPNWAAGSGKTE